MINKAVALLGTATLALRSRRKAGTAQRLSPLDNFFLMRLRARGSRHFDKPSFNINARVWLILLLSCYR